MLEALPAVLACWLGGCSSYSLDSDTALNLMQEHGLDPVKISLSASPQLAEGDPKVKEAYDQLIQGHVLDCQTIGAGGSLCQAGVAGQGITQFGSTDLSLVVGHWVPAVITQINRSGTSGSTVEARLRFEPTPLYKEYQDAFDVIQNSEAGRTLQAERKDGKSAQAIFEHMEDGWHIEKMQ